MRSNIRRLLRLSGGAALAALMAACVPHRVRVDFDQSASFLGRHSYAWMDSTGMVRDNAASPFLERRVRRAIDQAMPERGFSLAAAGVKPDMLVTAFVVGPTAAEARAWSWSTVGSPGTELEFAL